ncbi:MAG: hypothetical protein ABW176_13015 [Candidatus Thiodiazotropha endolucinida]
MKMDELEVIQRSLIGIEAISEAMSFFRQYKTDPALREENPGLPNYINTDSINYRLGEALSALSSLATNTAVNVRVENLRAGGES